MNWHFMSSIRSKSDADERILGINSYMTNEWYLLSDRFFELDQLVEYLRTNSAKRIEFKDPANEVCTEAYDVKPTRMGATDAINYILSCGIEKSNVIFSGHGSLPVACFRMTRG